MKMKTSPLEKQAIIRQIEYAYPFVSEDNCFLPIKFHIELTSNYLSEGYHLKFGQRVIF